jgi:membrane fusion protein (multidrug efflux system)
VDERVNPQILAAQPAARQRLLPRLIAFVGIILLLAGGVAYWSQARHFEATDDAFIDGNISQVSAQVAGRVITVLVQDNEQVAAGQILLELDPRDEQVHVDQIEAQRAEAAASLGETRATMSVRQAELDQASANVRVAVAGLDQARRDLARYAAINPRAISAQQIDQARDTAAAALARMDASRQAEAAARAQIAVLKTRITGAEAALRLADANLAKARLQLSYTRILAPAAGHVARRTVELGNYVSPGQPLLAVVQPDCWVTANFKESQLRDMHPGQDVDIAIDAQGGRILPGQVASLQPGTGSVFSSLPAENATGNYVKVVQRLPVKITFYSNACATLAPGLSVETSVHVR